MEQNMEQNIKSLQPHIKRNPGNEVVSGIEFERRDRKEWDRFE